MALFSSADIVRKVLSADPCNEAIISLKLDPMHHAKSVFLGLFTQVPRRRGCSQKSTPYIAPALYVTPRDRSHLSGGPGASLDRGYALSTVETNVGREVGLRDPARKWWGGKKVWKDRPMLAGCILTKVR